MTSRTVRMAGLAVVALYAGAMLLVVVLLNCRATTGPEPPPMPPLPPTVTHPPTMESCDLAEAKLRELDCRRADGASWATTPKGTPFAEACKRALADSRPWMSNCIARITDCSMLMPAYRGEWCGGVADGGAK